MQQTSLHELIPTVTTAEDLVTFLQRLEADFRNNPDEWQNDKLPTCFEAMAAWVNDMEKVHRRDESSLGNLNPFRLCASVLYAAKVYE
jgi:hypothetical protein